MPTTQSPTKRRNAGHPVLMSETLIGPAFATKLEEGMGDMTTEGVADLLGELDRRVKAHKTTVARVLKAAEKEMRKRADNAADDDKPNTVGLKYDVTLGVVPSKRTVTDMDKALDMLEEVADLSDLVKVDLKMLDDYLNPIQREEIIAESREGLRRITIKAREG